MLYEVITKLPTAHVEMIIAGRHQSHPRHQAFAPLGEAHRQRTVPIEPLGITGHEAAGHMLYNQHAQAESRRESYNFV